MKLSRVGDVAATVFLAPFVIVGITMFYVTIWGLGHMSKPTYHGRRVR